MKLLLALAVVLAGGLSGVSAQSNEIDRMVTGFCYVSEKPGTGIEKQSRYKKNTYYVDQHPIVTDSNFAKTTIFQEKGWTLFYVWLDTTGAEKLNAAIQNAKGRKIGFLVTGMLLIVQPANDANFFHVRKGTDPRVYGDIVALPPNTATFNECQTIKRILDKMRR